MYRILTNGDIEFFKTPKQPLPLENYTPDPHNQRVYRLALPVCTHREYQCETKPCGAVVGVWSCKHYQRTISPDECRSCPIPKEKATQQ